MSTILRVRVLANSLKTRHAVIKANNGIIPKRLKDTEYTVFSMTVGVGFDVTLKELKAIVESKDYEMLKDAIWVLNYLFYTKFVKEQGWKEEFEKVKPEFEQLFMQILVLIYWKTEDLSEEVCKEKRAKVVKQIITNLPAFETFLEEKFQKDPGVPTSVFYKLLHDVEKELPVGQESLVALINEHCEDLTA